MTGKELRDRLCVPSFGGRVAEEIIFGEVSTGAHNDLGRATDIARSMVKEYGMSKKLGYVTFERERKPLFIDLGASFGGAKDYSEETAREIDDEIKLIVEEARERVTPLSKNLFLKKLQGQFLEKETIEGEELRELISNHSIEHEAN